MPSGKLQCDRRTLACHAWRLALAIPIAFHGAWNVGPEGAAWWHAASGLPPVFRFPVGIAEMAGALMLLSGFLRRTAAAGIALLMLGALPQHFGRGFSFKNGGWESPFVYFLLALSIALTPPDPQRIAHEHGSI